jgi:hypothetical protein
MVSGLFDDLDRSSSASSVGYSQFQLAALVGSMGREELCAQRYNRCQLDVGNIEQLLEANQ